MLQCSNGKARRELVMPVEESPQYCELKLHVEGYAVDGAEQVVAGRVALEEVLQVTGDEVIDPKSHYIGCQLSYVQIRRECDGKYEFDRLRNTVIVGVLLLLCE
jgi:hypothetical protein